MSSHTGKRKRDAEGEGTEELEIDITLPEPPSKKALRKSKKRKPSRPKENGQDTNAEESPVDNDIAHNSLQKTAGATTKSKSDTPYGIWIGNLPFNATKSMLQSFFTSASAASETEITPPITDEMVTRIHLPAPVNAGPSSKFQLKPKNRGFAYVDFSSSEAHAAALSLSETTLGGRRVLIKSARDFAGRPVKSASTETAETKGASKGMKVTSAKGDHTRTRRVFVGNLGFDVTREDLEKHFAPCGPVEEVFIATFEDSGKCKGFGWIAFENVEAAAAAARGWTYVDSKPSEGTGSGDEDGNLDNETNSVGSEDDHSKPKKKSTPKKRKWFVNQLQGRTLRCEFAEDATTRYKKRFGKEKQSDIKTNISSRAITKNEGKPAADSQNVENQNAPRHGISPGAPTDASKRRSHSKKGKISDTVKYRTGGISEGTGTKTTFD